MIWQKRGVDPTKDHLRLGIPLLVELHRFVDSFPRVGKKRGNVHYVGLESNVLVASYEFDIISLTLVESRNLQQSKWRIAGVVIGFY